MKPLRVADVMLRAPHVLSEDATWEEAHDAFASAHVHMVLLTRTGRIGEPLLGTLVRHDLTTARQGQGDRAMPLARLAGRTVREDQPAEEARLTLREMGHRRSAVVDDAGRLLGLLCLKRHGNGFCSDAGAASRRAGGAKPTDPPPLSARSDAH